MYSAVLANEFDLHTYPFDSQVFSLHLDVVASKGFAVMYSAKQSRTIDIQSGSFQFHLVECHSFLDTNHIQSVAECRIYGKRNWISFLINVIIPACIFTCLAFATLAFHVRQAMPRVGMKKNMLILSMSLGLFWPYYNIDSLYIDSSYWLTGNPFCSCIFECHIRFGIVLCAYSDKL